MEKGAVGLVLLALAFQHLAGLDKEGRREAVVGIVLSLAVCHVGSLLESVNSLVELIEVSACVAESSLRSWADHLVAFC